MPTSARTLADPARVPALAQELGFEWQIVLSRENPHLDVVAALAELLHGPRRRYFSAAADAVRRFPLKVQQRHLARVMTAPDRDSVVGRSRIESATLRLEDDPRLYPTLASYLRRERSPRIAKHLMWSLVHSAPAEAATARAVLATAKRFPELRKEAARALSYCTARKAPLAAFLKALPAGQRAAFRAFVRLA